MAGLRRFDYPPALLEDCACSDVARVVGAAAPILDGGGAAAANTGADDSCRRLFRAHAAHFGRPWDAAEEDRWLRRDADGSYPNLPDRFRHFLRSMAMVYRHSQRKDSLMHLVLNRFSDQDWDEDAEAAPPPLERRLLRSMASDVPDLALLAAENPGVDVGILTELFSADSILHVTANLGIGKGSMNVLRGPPGFKPLPPKALRVDNRIHIPSDGAPGLFRTPEVSDPGLDGNVLTVKKQRKRTKPRADAGEPGASPSSADDGGDDDDNDAFATRLDWATTNNPDGVPLVHPPIDQGKCGSCWALAATGSLEASAARREAYEAFQEAPRDRHPGDDYDDSVNGTVRDRSVAYARQVEAETFQELDLSVQELIDCDQSADQGCTGGNPLLAFYFIHRYGLTSTDNYPYVGFEDTCKNDLIKSAIATVHSWGVISPNHEDHMALVLRYVGPIAVGVNGADPAFRSYGGGIFDHTGCKQGANHALLVTGYDQETLADGSTVRYWIARNSWGTDWGINGFVKVLRGDGRRGTPGICGIARSPSVALGGQLLTGDRARRFAIPGYAKDRGPLSDFCYRAGLGMNLPCLRATTWMDRHHALTLGAISVAAAAVAVWVLSRGPRRRWRRRQQQKREQQERLAAAAAANGGGHRGGEATSLVPNGEPGRSYGSNEH